MADILIGLQFGDEGKGKITDILSKDVDTVIRFQGGANAGHTIVVDGKEYKLHMVPSGIIQGKQCLIGNGCVVDFDQVEKEFAMLTAAGHDISLIKISKLAHVVVPEYKKLDSQQEEGRTNKIGTTQRGIGPTYEAKIARRGIQVGECYEPFITMDRLRATLSGVYLDEEIRDIAYRLRAQTDKLQSHFVDGIEFVQALLESNQRILLEGAQGTLLDVDFGSYPYVTSSSTTAGGACTGSGISPLHIENIWGVFKAYVTRVGEGPFDTEDCKYGQERPDGTFEDAEAYIREKGHEFGTTTGRPRRIGWLDLPALKRAIAINGCNRLAMMKLDVLSGLDLIKVCYDYLDNRIYTDEWTPMYEEFEGWTEDISGITNYFELPLNAQKLIVYIENEIGRSLDIISTSNDRSKVINLD